MSTKREQNLTFSSLFHGFEFMLEARLSNYSIHQQFNFYIGVKLNSVVLKVKYPNGIVFLWRKENTTSL